MGTSRPTVDEMKGAPLTVWFVDEFMSGWGRADGRTNVVVIPCPGEREASLILALVSDDHAMAGCVDGFIHPEGPSGAFYPLADPDHTGRLASFHAPDAFLRRAIADGVGLPALTCAECRQPVADHLVGCDR